MTLDPTQRRRSFETPEGVAVAVELADLGSRAAALLVDVAIIVGAILLAALLMFYALAWVFGSQLGVAMFLLVSFFLRCPYFLFFELRWQGQTPGKRLLGLRVVDRRGHALSPSGLAARNLMREVEVFMPLTLLLSGLGGGTELAASALAWLGVFTLMPVFNRDRLRIGDMLGGTWVISTRRTALEHDLTSGRFAPRSTRKFRFSKAQLDVYGIAELQVLERILRQPGETGRTLAGRATQREVLQRVRSREVLQRICARIGWREAVEKADEGAFLADYYAALRQHLERRALFGERRVDKHAIAGGGSSSAGAGPRPRASAWDE